MSNIKLTLLIFCSIFCIGGCSSMDTFGASLEPKKSDFPNRPIELIVPASPGGGSDMQARLFEKFASQKLLQPLVVINKPGAAGTIAWNELIHSKADGYTLAITVPDLLLHTLYHPKETHYFTTIDPIAQISVSSFALVVAADQPWQNLTDLIDYARQNPGKLKFSNSGVGSFSHLLGEALAKSSNTHITQVPFHGGGESIAALLGHHVQCAFLNPAIIKEHIKSGALKIIAITSEKRSSDPFYSNIPTLKESGYDIVLTDWKGIGAPKELPPDVKAKLEDALKQAVADPEFKAYMTKAGMEIEYLDNEQSRQKWVREIEALKKMLDSTGILEEVRSHQK